MAESPKPKGGIADTAEGIEFIGRKLTKDEIGGNVIIGSKLTDASRFKPFSVQNVGIENRYSLLREYGDDLAKKFEETIRFMKENPDVRFSQMQQDNILYNLGVYRRVVAEKDKIAKGLTEQGKNVDDIFNKRVDNLPEEMLTMNQVLEKFNRNIMKMKEKLDEIKGPSKKELDEKELRLKRLYDGPGYDRPGSSLYRGYGSFFLPKIHEKGIIKLDDKIYDNLKEGRHHHGGADYFAPDPVRIWRKHFGNEVFEKLDNFKPESEDIFQWLERNNIQPIQKDGPKNALEYLTPTEISQQLADETSAFGKYKNPESAGDDAQYYYPDNPKQRMERITYHGENIGALEQALQALDPDSYKEYFRTKPTYDSKILPFKELNAEGGRVGFGEGSEGIVEIDFASAEDKAFSDMMEAYRYYLISGGKKSLRDYMRMSTGAGRKGGGREHFRGAEGGRVGFQGGGRDASQVDFDPGPGEISSDAGFANTGKSLATQEIKTAPQIFDIGTVGDPALNPGSDNVKGGIDYTPSFIPPTFFEQALGTGQKIFNNPFVRAGILQFLPPQLQTLGQLFTLANSLKTAKNIYDESVEQSINDSLKTSFIDGLNINEKLLEKEAEGEFGIGIPKPIDTGSVVEKKLEGLIPEGTDLRTDAEKEAERFTNLKETYFPNRELFNRFMMMDPDPKIKKDLLNLKNLDVQLTYPDQKVLNEEGYIDKEKLKSTIDRAEILGTANVGPFTFSRNIDTEGEGITSGSFDTKYLDIDSPNLEENQYLLTAKAPLENIDLSSTFNVQDGNVTGQRYDLNMDGLEGSYKIGDGFSTRNLELDKNFTLGNFDFGIDGSYDDYRSEDHNRYSSYFTPSVSYNQNIGDGILKTSIAKEIIQGGDVPNLSFAGFYPVMGGELTGSLTNVLSDNMGATVGYDYKMGSPNLNNYLELKARADPFNLRDSALYFGLKKEF